MPASRSPRLGVWLTQAGTHVRVWAPHARTVELLLSDANRAIALDRDADGYWHAITERLPEYTRYAYRLDAARVLPDPASRFQPDGVHGPSAVIDPRQFPWSDAGWVTPPLRDLVIYELHVGTFAGDGRFTDVTARLHALAALGVTAVELMPIAAFAGHRGWGYDGVDLFAPHAAYGRPDDLRLLVDRAHRLGIAVLLDVVYNHLGPDGAYLSAYAAEYFHESHRTPWGSALNLDGPGAGPVREFVIDNALHWLTEYHLDGLRLDATHALIDTAPRHLLAELSEHVRDHRPDTILIAEDERRLARIVRPVEEGGWGFDGLWADDFHHELRRLVAGDHEGYFAPYRGTVTGVADALAHGWTRRRNDRESLELAPPAVAPAAAAARTPYIICLQNHDQIGNRALGTRLNHEIDAATFRAATVLLLTAPETPLLFMGQEWAASTPFLYFTDHEPDLGAAVTAGRRAEFAAFSAFRDAITREQIPDPQDPRTFEKTRLRWEERVREPHAAMLRFQEALLALRRTEPAFSHPDAVTTVSPLEPDAIALRRSDPDGGDLLVVARLRGSGPVHLEGGRDAVVDPGDRWVRRLSSEDDRFATDPQQPSIEMTGTTLVIGFARPGALVLARQSGLRGTG